LNEKQEVWEKKKILSKQGSVSVSFVHDLERNGDKIKPILHSSSFILHPSTRNTITLVFRDIILIILISASDRLILKNKSLFVNCVHLVLCRKQKILLRIYINHNHLIKFPRYWRWGAGCMINCILLYYWLPLPPVPPPHQIRTNDISWLRNGLNK